MGGIPDSASESFAEFLRYGGEGGGFLVGILVPQKEEVRMNLLLQCLSAARKCQEVQVFVLDDEELLRLVVEARPQFQGRLYPKRLAAILHPIDDQR